MYRAGERETAALRKIFTAAPKPATRFKKFLDPQVFNKAFAYPPKFPTITQPSTPPSQSGRLVPEGQTTEQYLAEKRRKAEEEYYSKD